MDDILIKVQIDYWERAKRSLELFNFKGFKGAETCYFMIPFNGFDKKIKPIRTQTEKWFISLLGGVPATLKEIIYLYDLEKPTIYNSYDQPNDLQQFIDSNLKATRNNESFKTEIHPETLRWLRDQPLDYINEELSKVMVGEEDSRRTICLIAIGGAFCRNAAPTSSNLLVNDESGAGKDFITRNVLKVLPDEWRVKRVRISETTFTYWHTVEKEPEWTWTGKIFYAEDISSAVLNCDAVKLLASKSEEIEHSQITIKQRSVEIGIRGKPVFITTSYSTRLSTESLRRFPIINLDTSEAQTKAILERIAEQTEKGICIEPSPIIKSGLRTLQPVKVKVLYAKKLIGFLSHKNVIVRTHFSRFLDYIKFSATIHQYAREKDLDGYIIAKPQDYDIARVALLKTTSNVFSIPLTRNQKKILNIFKALEKEVSYSVSDLSPKASFISERQLYRELDKLVEHGFLQRDNQERESSRKAVAVYRFDKRKIEIKIPKWEEM